MFYKEIEIAFFFVTLFLVKRFFLVWLNQSYKPCCKLSYLIQVQSRFIISTRRDILEQKQKLVYLARHRVFVVFVALFHRHLPVREFGILHHAWCVDWLLEKMLFITHRIHVWHIFLHLKFTIKINMSFPASSEECYYSWRMFFFPNWPSLTCFGSSQDSDTWWTDHPHENWRHKFRRSQLQPDRGSCVVVVTFAWVSVRWFTVGSWWTTDMKTPKISDYPIRNDLRFACFLQINL